MRRWVPLFAVFFLAGAVYADDRGATRFSVMATDFSYTVADNTGSRAEAGLSIAVSHRFGEKWGLEVSYGFERGHDITSTYHEVSPGTYLVDSKRIGFNVRPFDIVGQFFIPTGQSRWRPYIGVGARYTPTPAQSLKRHSYAETNPEINAGAILNLTPRLGIRFDAKFLVGSNNARWDEPLKSGVGLSFRF